MSGPWITQHEEGAVLDALRNGWYGEDAYTYCEKFEEAFAGWHDRNFALMTPNCTTAIHLLLAGLRLEAGDEVLVPECTWIASAAPITYTGATPVFCDIDKDHWCVTAASLEAKRTSRTRAVIVVDLYGNLPDWVALTKWAEKHQVVLIEDSAEALGSQQSGVRAGKFGVASVFSFHRTKTLTTGEGGMLLLDDDALFERCKLLRDHGRAPGAWYNEVVAFKYMPFNLQAALGYAQFQRIDELVGKKRWILEQYREGLKGLSGVEFNFERPDDVNGAWCTTVVFAPKLGINKISALEFLEAKKISARPFFFPLSMLPAFGAREEEGQKANPVAYDISCRGICLPSALNLEVSDIAFVCKMVRELVEHHGEP